MARIAHPAARLALCFALTLGASSVLSPALAQIAQADPVNQGGAEGDLVAYIARGDSEPEHADAGTTYALGAILHTGEGFFFGGDLGFEGVEIDTRGGRSPEASRSLSYNGIVGRSIGDGQSSPRVSLGVMLGFYQTAVTCPPSNLGFDCYANFEPETSSDLTIGLLAMADMGGFAFGLRATELSQQIVVGLSF